MSKRIWFTQQAPYDFMSLRAGLGLITETELHNHSKRLVEIVECLGNGDTYGCFELCPKIYTTRTRPLSGEYVVVEGSRFKAKPVEPRIEFRVSLTALLDLTNGLVCPIHDGKPDYESWACIEILDRNSLSFAELDLGIKGSSYPELRNILLKLNPKATITPFYVNRLEAMD